MATFLPLLFSGWAKYGALAPGVCLVPSPFRDPQARASMCRYRVQTRCTTRRVGLRALIIDDSAVMRKVIERALHQAGLDLSEVLQASNGEEALQALRDDGGNASPLALILSDINMPVMDGLQFLEQRRKENLAQGVPVVMITTEGSEPFVLRAIAAGAQGYICKPFTAEQVKARVLPLLRAA
jgi:two-component system chemotaxis response regulator CheY